MDVKGTSGVVPLRKVLFLVLILCAIFSVSLSKVNDTNDQILNAKKPQPKPAAPSRSSGHTFHFAIQGNVYPLGYYTVKVAIGNPPQLYDLDIDSGSDLTWVQSKSCKTCTPRSQYYPYNPNSNIQCKEPLCAALNRNCAPPTGPCKYKIEYADNEFCSGVLVRDFISFRLDDGSILHPQLGFGEHYRAGPVDLLFNGKQAVNGLEVIFDSGSTYTYLNKKAYNVLFGLINNDLGNKVQRATEDTTLVICWKGQNLFGYFKNIVLNFPKTKSQFVLTPQSYLIVSERHNTCLGILDGSEELGDINIIGDVSFQDKLVVYDNEKMQIGWVPDNCATSSFTNAKSLRVHHRGNILS
ncbi:aspartyl protease APCB1 isoform X2 [Arachis hypogaea]|uniref:aspartyl protease APCB1 isoform X2 n=1 Tax=Arachis hypogaea TaxID=3818 RepID=UPI000DEDCA19|nr:aspartic proteinase Asp1 isoform X2 [Arachis hypogaea]QHN93998.1 Aspartic proteinase [Arachis hypogaea]